MFIDSKVNHVKFGNGVIKDIDINAIDQTKSKVTVEFDNGKISKFSLGSFGSNGFFTSSDDIITYVDNVIKENKEKRRLEIEEKAKSIVYIPSHNLNEYDKEVTKEDWEKALKVAGSYRFPNESRAVTMNSDLIFINASAAMRYLDSRVKDCDKIYKACDSGKKFLGCNWKYSSKEDIEHIISLIEV